MVVVKYVNAERDVYKYNLKETFLLFKVFDFGAICYFSPFFLFLLKLHFVFCWNPNSTLRKKGAKKKVKQKKKYMSFMQSH